MFVALLIVLIWGTNFIAIFVALKSYPPFLLSAIRFGLSALPWVFILPKPKAPFRFVLGYGIFNFALQFGFLFSGIHLGLSPGLASLLLQVSVFFSMGLAFLFFKEKPSFLKVVGSLISFVGIGIVAAHIDGQATLIGLVLTLLAAFAWSAGNMFTKKVNAQSPLALVVWGNLIAFPIMVVASMTMEGPALMEHSLQNTSWATVAAVFYIVYISTHIGYGAWGFLLKSYSASAVVPFTLLIPVIGFLSSAIFLGEDLLWWKILASLFIMGGLVFGLLEGEVRRLFKISTSKKKEKYLPVDGG
ncbi:EamA family transporter [Paradesertivirga mongoliensis]|uniref:EamA family transporter n=1 Tax=Paradesertivirga mongoliensis TaxID=2100740 RepID=A0ABW4ZNI2_9SPHI|nr:EamA family transporter [Pedobacter mongoliensis]